MNPAILQDIKRRHSTRA